MQSNLFSLGDAVRQFAALCQQPRVRLGQLQGQKAGEESGPAKHDERLNKCNRLNSINIIPNTMYSH